ncbi:hypothetical protein SK128_011034, partial [Halocaridina rubra]
QRLDNLEEDISMLHEEEERLEQRLRKFSLLKSELGETIEDIHAKLEDLALVHKTGMQRNQRLC